MFRIQILYLSLQPARKNYDRVCVVNWLLMQNIITRSCFICIIWRHCCTFIILIDYTSIFIQIAWDVVMYNMSLMCKDMRFSRENPLKKHNKVTYDIGEYKFYDTVQQTRSWISQPISVISLTKGKPSDQKRNFSQEPWNIRCISKLKHRLTRVLIYARLVFKLSRDNTRIAAYQFY